MTSLPTVRLSGRPYLFSNGPDAVPDIQVGAWLMARGCALARVSFTLTPDLASHCWAVLDLQGKRLIHDAGMWIHRCARRWGVRAQALLVKLQQEQSLLSVKFPQVLDPDFIAVRVQDVPEDRGEDSYFRDSGGVLRVTGERRMFAACGFGIPDAGKRVPWNLECSAINGLPMLGFANQIAHTAEFWRHQHDRYMDGRKTVNLYGNIKVLCADVESFVLLQHCPSAVVDGFDPAVTAPFGDQLVMGPQMHERYFPST